MLIPKASEAIRNMKEFEKSKKLLQLEVIKHLINKASNRGLGELCYTDNADDRFPKLLPGAIEALKQEGYDIVTRGLIKKKEYVVWLK